MHVYTTISMMKFAEKQSVDTFKLPNDYPPLQIKNGNIIICYQGISRPTSDVNVVKLSNGMKYKRSSYKCYFKTTIM